MSWKVASEKSGNLIGPGLIHVLGSLCSTTTCRTLSRGVSGLRRHPRGSRRAFYARSCIRTSENSPSETVWKIGIGAESGFRRGPRGGEEAQIGRFLESKKHAR